MADRIAIVGVGTTTYGEDLGRSRGSLATEACINAIHDAGIDRNQIDGICGGIFQASPQYLQEGLGIDAISWWQSPPFLPFSMPFTDTVNAILGGMCKTAIVVQSQFRTASNSSTAARRDAIRARPDPAMQIDRTYDRQYFLPYGAQKTGYPGFMRRYMSDFNVARESFGLVAVNSRSNALNNPHAAVQESLSMDTYLSGKMVRQPMCIYDMDRAVDGADAFVLTSMERARDLRHRPIIVDAIAYGQGKHPGEEKYPETFSGTAQAIASKFLWERTDIRLGDIDVFFPYDGFTLLTLTWMEAFGFCGPGEAGDYLAESWDQATNSAKLEGRILLNPHGGSLSEGATQGAGHLREAAIQLRGDAGKRQAVGARTALLGIGGLFFNAAGIVLSVDD